jgi:hypothetical protein
VLLALGSVLVLSLVCYLAVSAIAAANRKDASREIVVAEAFDSVRITAEVADIVIEFSDVANSSVRFVQNGDRRNMTFQAEVVDGILMASVVDHGTGWLPPVDFTDSPRLTIVLPLALRDLDLSVNSDVGDISIDGEFADVHIVGTAGDLRLAGSAIQAEIETTVGDVRSDGYTVSEDLRIRSNTGNVELALESVPTGLDITSTVGDQHVTLPGGRYRVETTTTIGDVRVNVDDNSKAATLLRFETTIGDITVDEAS